MKIKLFIALTAMATLSTISVFAGPGPHDPVLARSSGKAVVLTNCDNKTGCKDDGTTPSYKSSYKSSYSSKTGLIVYPSPAVNCCKQ